MREFLDDLKQHGHAQGNFLGLLNVLIGHRIEKADGTVLSVGLTWRQTADWLKKVRWDKDAVRELGLDPAALPPRDRERFWYSAIARAHVDSPEASTAGDRLANALKTAGYVVK
jgi:hypothetical protein